MRWYGQLYHIAAHQQGDELAQSRGQDHSLRVSRPEYGKGAVPEVIIANQVQNRYNWRYRQGHEPLSGDAAKGKALL